MAESHVTQVTASTTQDANHGSSAALECTVNINYFKSWQGLLKIVKLVCILACLIASAVGNSMYYCQMYSNSTYSVAVSVLSFLTELFWLLLYVCSVNRRFPPVMKYVVTAYHSVLVVLYYAAIVAIANVAMCNASAFVAFGVIVLAMCALEIYFNMVWLKDGPELVALPCVAVGTTDGGRGTAGRGETYDAEQSYVPQQAPPPY